MCEILRWGVIDKLLWKLRNRWTVMVSSPKRLLEIKVSIFLKKKVKQSFSQGGFGVMFMSGVVQTSNFSSAIPEHV